MKSELHNNANESLRSVKVMDFKVNRLEWYSDNLFMAVLSPTVSQVPSYFAGQFVQILVPRNENGAFLRRPVSIYHATPSELWLLIQVVGKGTEALARAKTDDIWNIILPLGGKFTYNITKDFKPLLIGGGVGVAPMHALGAELVRKGIRPTFLLGARSARYFSNLDHFKKLGDLYITTEDGSLGEVGFVTQHTIIEKQGYSHIYTCGPTSMMKAVARIAKVKSIPCQVSLENHMACGFGVCLCCVEPTIKGNQTVCTEGPVFDVNDLLWE